MINFLDELILALFRAKLPLITVNFEQPTSKNAEGWGEHSPNLNFFLYDVRENNTLRQHQWQGVAGQNGNGRSQRKRSSFRFDCHYILTAWAENPIEQHRLLSQAVDLLLTYPQFTNDNLPETASASLKDWIKEQPYSIPTQVGSHDKLTNPAELWSALDNQIRPSISYLATIGINPWQAEFEAPPVTTRRLLLHPHSAAMAGDEELVQIGGHVTHEDKPLADATVNLSSGDGRVNYQATTDKNGRYRINSVTPGNYTLSAAYDNMKNEQAMTVDAAVPGAIYIKTEGTQFDLRIGSRTVRHQHMTPNQPGFIQDAQLEGFEIEALSRKLPRNGRYIFPRTEEDQPLAVTIPAQDGRAHSLEVRYTKQSPEFIHYDLAIES